MDSALSISTIGLLYNLFFHHIAVVMYQNQDPSEQFRSSLLFLSVVSGIGLYMWWFNVGCKSITTSRGIGFGSTLLLFSVALNSSQIISANMKLIIIGVILVIVLNQSNKSF